MTETVATHFIRYSYAIPGLPPAIFQKGPMNKAQADFKALRLSLDPNVYGVRVINKGPLEQIAEQAE